MQHPFEKLTAPRLRRVYWAFFALTAITGAITGSLNKYHPDGAPPGAPVAEVPTVTFEFAGTLERWNALAATAGHAGMEALRVQTYVDYSFLVCYSTLIAAGVIGVTLGTRSRALLVTARYLAWGQWLAGLLDAIENYGMLRNMAGPVSGTWLAVSYWCAAVKFAFVIFGTLYILCFLARPWRGDAD